MKIQATRAFLHERRVVQPLEVLEVANDFARALIHWDKARAYTEPDEAEAPEPSEEPGAKPDAAPEPEAPRRGKKDSK